MVAFNKGKQFGGGRPSFGGSRPSFGGGRPSFGGGRPSFGGNRGFGGGRDGGRPAMHKATCSECGDECELPFRPTGDRPVFCSSCFDKQGGGDRSSKFSGPRQGRASFEDRQMHDATCGKCGADCQVPFRPVAGKPVFCDNCFDKNDKGGRGAKNAVDYTDQFKMLNEKIDKLIGLLTPKTSVEKTSEKKATKAVEKVAKTKVVAKKTKTAATKKKK